MLTACSVCSGADEWPTTAFTAAAAAPSTESQGGAVAAGAAPPALGADLPVGAAGGGAETAARARTRN